MSIMVDVEPAIRSDTPSRQVLTGRAGVNAKRGLFTGQDFDRGHNRLAERTGFEPELAESLAEVVPPAVTGARFRCRERTAQP